MTSSCHQDVFLFDLNNKQQRKIRVKELPEYAEREEYNVKQVADKRPRIRFRNTYIAGDILDNELFLYAIGKKANYIVNLSKNGDLKRVYMLKILERPYLLYGMGVTRTKNDKPRMFLYYAAVKEDDSRVFPVCVLEPLE